MNLNLNVFVVHWLHSSFRCYACSCLNHSFGCSSQRWATHFSVTTGLSEWPSTTCYMVICLFDQTVKAVFWIRLVFTPTTCYMIICPFVKTVKAVFWIMLVFTSTTCLYGYLPFRQDNQSCILDKLGIYMSYLSLPFSTRP